MYFYDKKNKNIKVICITSLLTPHLGGYRVTLIPLFQSVLLSGSLRCYYNKTPKHVLSLRWDAWKVESQVGSSITKYLASCSHILPAKIISTIHIIPAGNSMLPCLKALSSTKFHRRCVRLWCSTIEHRNSLTLIFNALEAFRIFS